MTARFALAAVLAACTSFPPIDRGVCGNGLIEPGEDCDSSDPTCVACAVTCATAASCPGPDYSCGIDGLCHAPAGVVAQPTPPSLFLVDEFRLTDIDHDGIGDVLGASKTSLVVRFGDARGALTSTYSTVTPAQSGAAGFGDLDGDGSIDLAITTADGLASFASPYGIPSPTVSMLPVGANGSSAALHALFPVRSVAIGAIVDDTNGNLAIEILEFGSMGLTQQSAALCGGAIPGTLFTLSELDTYQASADTDATIDLVVSMRTGTGAGRKSCMTSIHLDAPDGNGARAAHFFDITPPGAVPTRRMVLADLDLDSDPCPSLVNSDGGAAGMRAWDGSMQPAVGVNPAHCGLANVSSALPTVPNATADSAAVGRIPLRPGFLLVGGDVLVMTTGLYLYNYSASAPNNVAFTQIYTSERKLRAVSYGDLDGDGSVDAVLSADSEDDLDVVYRVSDGPFSPGFEVLRVDTAGVVTTTTIGDFDGNGVGDIAYTEQLLGHEGMSIAYGLPGHSLTVLPEATFDQTISVIPFQIVDSTDPIGVVGDLIVLQQLAGVSAPQAVSLLQGSPQRTMLSYFDPRVAQDPLRNQVFRAITAGNFYAPSGTDAYPDLLAFVRDTSTGNGTPGVRMYRIDGTSTQLEPIDPINTGFGIPVSGLDDCGIGASSQYPCIRTARMTNWTTMPDHDVIIGVDRQKQPVAFVLDPWDLHAGGSTTAQPASAITASVAAGESVQSMYAADVDGDGTPELVVSFGPAPTAPASGPGLVEVCEVDPTGMPTACSDVGATIAQTLPGVTCVDAAPARFRPPSAPATASAQLLVLCHDPTGVSSLVLVDGAEASVVAANLGPLRSIEVGDVTGDGVDDVVAVVGDSGSQSLTVFAQCTSRDLTCQALGAAP